MLLAIIYLYSIMFNIGTVGPENLKKSKSKKLVKSNKGPFTNHVAIFLRFLTPPSPLNGHFYSIGLIE